MLLSPAHLPITPQPGQQVLVAVSGGLDSVVLLHLLHQAGWPMAVAHCNFSLRATESDEDGRFVQELAGFYGLSCHSRRFHTKEFAAENGISTQMAARELRYAWFEELREQQGYSFIATAHHLNDSMETLLLNLVRGTGPAGLRGIPLQSGHLLRPLSCFTRDQMEAYAQHHQLKWREDSSNATDHYKRNFLRHRVIPLLQELNPNLPETLHQTMQRMADAQDLIAEQAAGLGKEAMKQEQGRILLNTSVLPKKGLPLLLHELLRPLGFTYLQAQEITRNLQGQSGRLFLSPGYRLVIDRQHLILEPRVKENAPATPDKVWIEEGQKQAQLGSVQLIITGYSTDRYRLYPDPSIAALDAGKLQYPLLLRPWQPGDQFVPLGMKGRKNISDFLIDRKISLPDKEKVLVLLSGDEIVWVVGYRLSDRYRISDRTSQVLEIRADSALPSEKEEQ